MDVEPIGYPWERREGESDQAWEAFQMYRDMPLGEVSMRAVAKQLGKNETLIFRWSGRHDWVERRQAWELEQDRRRQEAMANEAVDMARRHATNSAAYMRTLLLPAETLIKRLRSENGIVDLEQLSTSELLKLTVAAARVFPQVMAAERFARGQTAGHAQLVRQTSGQKGAVQTDEMRLREVFAALEEAGLVSPGAPQLEENGDE